MLEAVLFDWGHTLIDFAFQDAFVEEGHRAGLAALGRGDLPAPDEVAALFRSRYEPLLWVPGTIEEVEYPGLVRELLGHFGVEISGEELDRFLEAEHEVWVAAQVTDAGTHALLDGLRAAGLRLGIVSNAFDPGWLLHRDLERSGLAGRVDFAVFSSEVGRRKPDPAIFRACLEALDADPARTLFVGDRLYEDVLGASRLGMRTVQALWFREDAHPDGGTPDFRARTPAEVAEIAAALA